MPICRSHVRERRWDRRSGRYEDQRAEDHANDYAFIAALLPRLSATALAIVGGRDCRRACLKSSSRVGEAESLVRQMRRELEAIGGNVEARVRLGH